MLEELIAEPIDETVSEPKIISINRDLIQEVIKKRTIRQIDVRKEKVKSLFRMSAEQKHHNCVVTCKSDELFVEKVKKDCIKIQKENWWISSQIDN